MNRIQKSLTLFGAALALSVPTASAFNIGPYLGTSRMDATLWEVGVDAFQRDIKVSQVNGDTTARGFLGDGIEGSELEDRALFMRYHTHVSDGCTAFGGLSYHMPSGGYLDGGGDYVSADVGIIYNFTPESAFDFSWFFNLAYAFNAETGVKGNAMAGIVNVNGRDLGSTYRVTEQNVDYFSVNTGFLLQSRIQLTEDGASLTPYVGVYYSAMSLVNEVEFTTETGTRVFVASGTDGGEFVDRTVNGSGSLKIEFESEENIGAVGGFALQFTEDWYARAEFRAVSETSGTLSIIRDL